MGGPFEHGGCRVDVASDLFESLATSMPCDEERAKRSHVA